MENPKIAFNGSCGTSINLNERYGRWDGSRFVPNPEDGTGSVSGMTVCDTRVNPPDLDVEKKRKLPSTM